jgi:hypothetical protein
MTLAERLERLSDSSLEGWQKTSWCEDVPLSKTSWTKWWSKSASHPLCILPFHIYSNLAGQLPVKQSNTALDQTAAHILT